jgi:hypothetical protein
VHQTLIVFWGAADRICGKRLKALIPMLVDAMERHGHLDLDRIIKSKLVQISAATIDRMLADARLHIDGQRKRRKAWEQRFDEASRRAYLLTGAIRPPASLKSTWTNAGVPDDRR